MASGPDSVVREAEATSPVRRSDLIGVGFALLGASAFGVGNLLSKITLDHGVTVATVVMVRFFIGALSLWALVACFGLHRDLPFRRAMSLSALGASFALQSTFMHESFARIPAALAALLLYTHPAMVAVATAALGLERWSQMRGAALALSLGGTALVLGAPVEPTNTAGVAFALGAAACLAANTIIVSRIGAGIHPFAMGACFMTGALLVSVVLGRYQGTTDLGLDATQWWLLTALGIVTMVVASPAILAAIVRLGPTRSTMGSTFEPVVTVVLSALFLSERLGPAQLAGGAMVIAAVALLPLIKSRTEAAPTGAPPR